jgi:hypothetical protein
MPLRSHAAISSGTTDEDSHDLAHLSAGRLSALFVPAFAIAALPILIVAVPPLVDYPNHLARMHIIAAEGASPFLRDFYAIAWRPLPDLAMDALVPLMARAMPLAWAGKAFLLLTFALIAGGTLALHRALFRRWSAWPCLAFLLLYNRPLLWGFTNFLFGVGLALVATAVWIGLRDQRPVLRHALAAFFALAIYFSHLFAFGAYALLILGYEAALLRRSAPLAGAAGLRALAGAAAQFVLPALIFLATVQSGDTGAIVYSRFFRKFDIFFNVVDNYVPWFDIASFAILALLFFWGAARGAIKLHPLMRWPLLILLAAQILMPNRLFGAAGVDHRMPLMLGLVLIASSDGFALPRRRTGTIAAGLALLFLARMAVLTSVWIENDRVLEPLAAALMDLPRGSKLAVAYPPSALHVSRRDPPVVHVAALAVIGADAFVPTLFVDPRHQPLALRQPYAALAAAASPGDFWDVLVDGRPEPEARVAAALAQYDFILLAGGGPFAPQAAAPLDLRAEGAGAKLFAVRREPPQ